MGYPALEEENELARLVAAGEAPERRLAEDLRVPVLQPGELEQLRAATARVRVSEAISRYVVSVARQTGSTRRSGLALGRGRR
jgi:MoxR-like ATPase